MHFLKCQLLPGERVEQKIAKYYVFQPACFTLILSTVMREAYHMASWIKKDGGNKVCEKMEDKTFC